MIPDFPILLSILFLALAVFTIAMFHWSNGQPTKTSSIIIAWSILHSVLAYFGFYQTMDGFPPRFILVLLPSTLFMIYGLLPKQLEWIHKNRLTRRSTFLHVVRVPVEISLYYLFVYQMVPELMTFEGRNFDIVAGITAPIIGWLWMQKKISKNLLIAWNVVGLCLILFILVNGLLSAELPFQQFGFDQPNRAVSYFPFILLPATIVPLVIYTHITNIIKLRKAKIT